VSDSTTRFTEYAQTYAVLWSHRPDYPPEVIDAVFDGLGEPHSLIFADIGAGTGISAQLLAERGARVIAIEPNAAMRKEAQFSAGIEWRDSRAEATGLADQSVDAAVAFQAFHWFANAVAIAEMRRIARRRAAIVQYERDERDERDAFTRAYGDIVRRYATDDTEALRLRALEVFSAFPQAHVTRMETTLTQDLDEAGVLGRAASASYLPRSGAAAAELRAELSALFAHFALAGSVRLTSRMFVLRADWT
jgi:SAM-dependent methyltransferase